jgi:site-specific recombinase XerD
MIKRAAVGAGLELKAHPHMLRHARSYAPLKLRRF